MTLNRGSPQPRHLDTVLYNLAGVHNATTVWGGREESYAYWKRSAQLGGEDWFRLGDRDLAVHLRRNEWVAPGGQPDRGE